MRTNITFVLAGMIFVVSAYAEYSYEGQWGSEGTGNGEFRCPRGVATLSDPFSGNWRVYVADGSNHRIQYFTPAGSYLGKWGSYGSGNGQSMVIVPVALYSIGKS